MPDEPVEHACGPGKQCIVVNVGALVPCGFRQVRAPAGLDGDLAEDGVADRAHEGAHRDELVQAERDTEELAGYGLSGSAVSPAT